MPSSDDEATGRKKVNLKVCAGVFFLIIAVVFELAYRKFGIAAAPPLPKISWESRLPRGYEKVLSQEQVDQFNNDGYTIVRGLMDSEELAYIWNLTGKLRGSEVEDEDTESEFESEVYAFGNVVLNPWMWNKGMYELLFESKLPKMVSELLNEPIRLMSDYLFILQPGETGIGNWHSDMFQTLSDTAMIWVALTTVNEEIGGGLALAAGTNTWTPRSNPCTISLYEAREKQIEEHTPKGKACRAKLESMKVIPSLEPGDALLFSRWTHHRSVPFTKPELQKKPRVGYVARFGDRDTTLHIPKWTCTGRPTWESYQNWGQKAGEIINGPWYPQVYPERLESELKTYHATKWRGISRWGFAKLVFEMKVHYNLWCW